MATDGYTGLQLGVGEAKLKRVNITTAGQYKGKDIKPKRELHEFRVTPDAILPVGTTIKAAHYYIYIILAYNEHEPSFMVQYRHTSKRLLLLSVSI